MKKEPLIAGLGWIFAGIVSLLAYGLIVNHRICSCPFIPANATPSQVANLCHCLGGSTYGLVIIGLVAIAAGITVLAFNRRIGRAMLRIRRR